MLDKKFITELSDLVERSLEEDIGDGDLTTEIVVSEPRYAKASIRSKDAGILAGIEIAEMVFLQVDNVLEIEKLKEDGDRIEVDDLLMNISGNGHPKYVMRACRHFPRGRWMRETMSAKRRRSAYSTKVN